VVTALTVIVFIIIAVLDQREKLQKKRLRHIEPASTSSDGSIGEEIEKKGPLVDEEDVTLTHEVKY
jgi:hypothetical protein